jgi:hypothetical protein
VVVPKLPKKPTMDYDTLMSKIPDGVKERYSFAYNEKLNAIQIMNMQSSMSMTIPIDQVDFIKEDEFTINIWVVEKYALNIFKNVNLINLQVF